MLYRLALLSLQSLPSVIKPAQSDWIPQMSDKKTKYLVTMASLPPSLDLVPK